MHKYPELNDKTGGRGASPGAAAAPMSTEAIIQPSLEYIAPASNFFFMAEPQRNLMSFLPSRYVTDRLIDQYWECVHYMCRIVHRPSFERQYASFWQSIQQGVEPPASLQAIVLAALLSAVVSMTEQEVVVQFGVERAHLVDSFKNGTETALAKANFLRSTKLLTLQAMVMYLASFSYSTMSHTF